jgi:hypothetical protein
MHLDIVIAQRGVLFVGCTSRTTKVYHERAEEWALGSHAGIYPQDRWVSTAVSKGFLHQSLLACLCDLRKRTFSILEMVMSTEIVVSYWGDLPPSIGMQNVISNHCDISQEQSELGRQ